LDEKRRRVGTQRQGRPAESPVDYEKAQASAYLLLASIQAMLIENPDLLELMQDLPHAVPQELLDGTAAPGDAPERLTILEALLAIGVYSDCDSPIAPLAFRLVLRIAHGYGDFRVPQGEEGGAGGRAALWESLIPPPEDEPPPSNPRFEHPFYKAIVAHYAEDFQFAYPVTNQMATGFAVFWNHRSQTLTPGTVFGNPRLNDKEQARYAPEITIHDADGTEIGPYPPREKADQRPKRAPFTPLEIFGHLLFFDPPHRDDLNLVILRVLHWYHDSFRSLRAKEFGPGDSEGYIAYQKALYHCDLMFYNFLTTKFDVNNVFLDMTHLKKALPMFPADDRLAEKLRGTVRAPLNGACAAFGFFWVGSDFFSESGRLSGLAEVDGIALDPKLIDAIYRYCGLAQSEVKLTGPVERRRAVGPMEDRGEPPAPPPSALCASQRSVTPQRLL
jgi:hypothetical protein